MPYVTGYEHDVFMSYAHIDNEPVDTDRGWVTTLVEYLRTPSTGDSGIAKPTSGWITGSTGNEPFAHRHRGRVAKVCDVLSLPPLATSDPNGVRGNASLPKAVVERTAAGSELPS